MFQENKRVHENLRLRKLANIRKIKRTMEILLIAEETFTSYSMARHLERVGHSVEVAITEAHWQKLLSDRRFNLVIAEVSIARPNVNSIAHHLSRHGRSTPVIFLASDADMAQAIKADHPHLKAIVVTKPENDSDLLRSLADAVYKIWHGHVPVDSWRG